MSSFGTMHHANKREQPFCWCRERTNAHKRDACTGAKTAVPWRNAQYLTLWCKPHQKVMASIHFKHFAKHHAASTKQPGGPLDCVWSWSWRSRSPTNGDLEDQDQDHPNNVIFKIKIRSRSWSWRSWSDLEDQDRAHLCVLCNVILPRTTFSVQQSSQTTVWEALV